LLVAVCMILSSCSRYAERVLGLRKGHAALSPFASVWNRGVTQTHGLPENLWVSPSRNTPHASFFILPSQGRRSRAVFSQSRD
jgi:hypothetical protein